MNLEEQKTPCHPFETVFAQLEQLAEVPGKKDKLGLIEKFSKEETFKQVVVLALDFSYVFHLKKLPQSTELRETQYLPLVHALKHLAQQKGCTHNHAQEIANLAGSSLRIWEVIRRIVTKDLRCGASINSFKKVIPELPLHKPMLCTDDLDKTLKLVKGDISQLLISLKLDGVRVWVVIHENKVKYLSRNGKEYKNFSCFDEEVLAVKDRLPYQSKTIIFDGEVISKDKDFQKQMTQVRRLENADVSIFRLVLFDWVVDGTSLENRLTVLEKSVSTEDRKNPRVTVVPHQTCEELNLKTKQAIVDHCYHLCEQGEEGIVVKTKQGDYEYKRSTHWCKVKQFHTEDLFVLGWEKGTGRNANRMGKLLCNYKENKVYVGSGFSDAEREEFMENCPKMIEVQYQNVTRDGSLRFPTFVRVRDDK